MNTTAIGWTDFSANPLKYRDADGAVKWACAKVSAGCTNCYSEALAKRWSRGGDYNAAEVAKLTPFLDGKEIHAMLTSKKIIGKRVFVGDMTDIFGEWVPDELLDRLFAVMALRQDVTWQVLTKRAARMRDYLTATLKFHDSSYPAAHWRILLDHNMRQRSKTPLQIQDEPWPLPNVWLGVSCEDQQRVDERVPKLLTTPASVRFVSAEPLLGDVWFHDFAHTPAIDWVIVGGESGPRYRPCHLDAILAVVDQCRASSVAVFVKQDAHRLPGQQGRIPDSHFIQQFPAEAS